MLENKISTKTISKVQRRLNLIVICENLLYTMIITLIFIGLALTLVKMLSPNHTGIIPYGLIIAPVIFVYFVRKSRVNNRFYNSRDAVQVLELLADTDGKASTSIEKPNLIKDNNFWQETHEKIKSNSLNINYFWFLKKLCPAVLFLILALLIPSKEASAVTGIRNAAKTVTTPVQQQLELMKEFLPEEKYEELKSSLEKIDKEDEVLTKEKWEALEDIRARMENTIAENITETNQINTTLNDMAAALQERANNDSGTTSTQQDSGLPNINELSEELAKQMANSKINMSDDMKADMDKFLKEAQNTGKPNQEQLKELQKKLDSMCDKMGQCSGNGSTSGNGNKPGNGNNNGEGNSDGEGNGEDGGSGGVSRGPGSGGKVLGTEKSIQADFNPQQLERQYMDFDSLQDMGITPVSPKPEPGIFSQGTQINQTAKSGDNVSRTDISPMQKQSVSRYFDTNSK